jgi:CBS-domain-containing membrane protein
MPELNPQQYLQSLSTENTISGLPTKLVTCDLQDKAKDALTKLADAKIHSMPILDYHDQHYIGSVDILDFVHLMVNLHGTTSGSPPAYRYATEWVEFNDATVKTVVDLLKGKASPGTETIPSVSNLSEVAAKLVRIIHCFHISANTVFIALLFLMSSNK